MARTTYDDQTAAAFKAAREMPAEGLNTLFAMFDA
jgi:hypothetical protein